MTMGLPSPRRREYPSIDPGLQSERTAMAWQRTALGLGGMSALLLHHAQGNRLAAIPGVLGMVVAVGFLVMAERRYEHTVRRVVSGDLPAGPLAMRLIAGAVLMLALSALVLVALGTD